MASKMFVYIYIYILQIYCIVAKRVVVERLLVFLENYSLYFGWQLTLLVGSQILLESGFKQVSLISSLGYHHYNNLLLLTQYHLLLYVSWYEVLFLWKCGHILILFGLDKTFEKLLLATLIMLLYSLHTSTTLSLIYADIGMTDAQLLLFPTEITDHFNYDLICYLRLVRMSRLYDFVLNANDQYGNIL